MTVYSELFPSIPGLSSSGTMYSLFAKKESAHEDAIWTCAWGRRPERTEMEEVEVEVEVEEEEEEVRTERATFGG